MKTKTLRKIQVNFIKILEKPGYYEEKIVDYTFNNKDSMRNYESFSNDMSNSNKNNEGKKFPSLSIKNLINENVSINTNISSNKKVNFVQKIVNYIIKSKYYKL